MKPRTYDDITRATVVDPDSSRRPSREQEEAAFTGDHTRSADEHRIAARVDVALRAHPEGRDVQVEVERDRIVLRGRVREARFVSELEDLVVALGVGSVDNKIVVGS